jgi:hypothetical protein
MVVRDPRGCRCDGERSCRFEDPESPNSRRSSDFNRRPRSPDSWNLVIVVVADQAVVVVLSLVMEG